MMKKFFLTLFLIFSTCLLVMAEDAEIPVKIEALNPISTANVNLQEGDSITMVVSDNVYVNSKLYIKQGAVATGVITSLVDNGFTCQEASIYAENFKVKNAAGKTVPLKGIVYKQGRNHSLFTQFLPTGFHIIRGGEAKIEPQKDNYTLYLKGTNVDAL